jgi:hypothetical protein
MSRDVKNSFRDRRWPDNKADDIAGAQHGLMLYRPPLIRGVSISQMTPLLTSFSFSLPYKNHDHLSAIPRYGAVSEALEIPH